MGPQRDTQRKGKNKRLNEVITFSCQTPSISVRDCIISIVFVNQDLKA